MDYDKPILNESESMDSEDSDRSAATVILTETGMEKVAWYLQELRAKRKEILDAGKDTAFYTDLPTISDILSDIESFEEDDEYYNNWGVTDNVDGDEALNLKRGKDYVAAQHIYNINWDTDGLDPKELHLPQETDIPYSVASDEVADYLSDTFGFCVNSFKSSRDWELLEAALPILRDTEFCHMFDSWSSECQVAVWNQMVNDTPLEQRGFGSFGDHPKLPEKMSGIIFHNNEQFFSQMSAGEEFYIKRRIETPEYRPFDPYVVVLPDKDTPIDGYPCMISGSGVVNLVGRKNVHWIASCATAERLESYIRMGKALSRTTPKRPKAAIMKKMAQTAEAVRETFEALAIPAKFYFCHGKESAYFSIRVTNAVRRIEHNFPESYQTLDQLWGGLNAMVNRYPAEERHHQYPKELRLDSRNVWDTLQNEIGKDTLHKAMIGILAAHDIVEEKKDPQEVYKKYTKKIQTYNINQCKKECRDFSTFLTQCGLSKKDIQKAMKEVMQEEPAR